MVEDRGGGGVALQQVECAACRRSICDRYIMRVADASYHERCLLCCACGTRLAHSCFTKDAKLYCKLDYDRCVTNFQSIHSIFVSQKRHNFNGPARNKMQILRCENALTLAVLGCAITLFKHVIKVLYNIL